MRIQVRLPSVSMELKGRASACPHCGRSTLQGWGRPGKMIRDCRHEEVEVRRYRCTGCGKTFRDYPEGVTRRQHPLTTGCQHPLTTGCQQSQRLQALSVLLYVLGLAYDGV